MRYEVDFDKWVMLMLPTFLRRTAIFALCRTLCSAAKSLHADFLAARKEHLFRLNHNGQVCYLRSALNETFGRTGSMTKFDILDASDDQGGWLYSKHEDMVGQLYAATEGDVQHASPVPVLASEARLNAPHNSFIVVVPAEIYNNASLLEQVKAVVDSYRILSKQPVYTF